MDSYYTEPPRPEIAEMVEQLDQNSSILDLGCGPGRTSLFFAEKGFTVTAVDFSSVALEQLKAESVRRGVNLKIIAQDLSDFKFKQNYDISIAHGSLHFLDRLSWTRLITKMKEYTNKGGYNIIAVFTDKIPSPPDMKEVIGHLFKEGELLELYKSWEILLWESYIKEDEHPNSIKHQHPINKIVARNITNR